MPKAPLGCSDLSSGRLGEAGRVVRALGGREREGRERRLFRLEAAPAGRPGSGRRGRSGSAKVGEPGRAAERNQGRGSHWGRGRSARGALGGAGRGGSCRAAREPGSRGATRRWIELHHLPSSGLFCSRWVSPPPQPLPPPLPSPPPGLELLSFGIDRKARPETEGLLFLHTILIGFSV